MSKQLPKETTKINVHIGLCRYGAIKAIICDEVFAEICKRYNLENYPTTISGKPGVYLEVKGTGKCGVKEIDNKPKLKVTILPTACKPQIEN
jgi:hypothetical protein